MSYENPISLGDVARVMSALRPQGARTWNRILDALGLPLEIRERISTPQLKPGEEAPSEPSDEPDAMQDVDRGEESWEPPPPAPAPVLPPGDELAVEPEGSAVTSPDWSDATNVISGWPMDAPVSLDPPPTLFAPGQGRSLLTAAAIALAETGELDEDRAIQLIARGEPLQEIPLRLRPTSRFGVQLLVDRGPRMQPFREDQQRLRDDLFRTVGAHRVDVLRFTGLPDMAGPGTPRTWAPYRPPSAGTVILILTDLALGWLGTMERTYGLGDWIDWAKTVRSAGAHPVALVPHGPRHWPEPLRHNITMVHWDRSTTVGAIRCAAASLTARHV